MHKSFIKFFTIIFGCLFLFNIFPSVSVFAADDKIPSWYTGDADLYKKFVFSCNVTKKKCPYKDLNCEVSSLDEFTYMRNRIKSCVDVQQTICGSVSCDVEKAKTVLVSSERG